MLAVAVTVTCPAALVVPVVGLNVAPAPLEGVGSVTDTPLTGLLLVSVTVATNGFANAVLSTLRSDPSRWSPTVFAVPAVLVNV